MLDNLPGPKSDSWFTGSLLQIIGNDAWGFHKMIGQTYGGIVRIKGLLGRNELYIFDPKALHHILVKDQYVYEETDGFIEANKLVFGKGIFTSLGEEHRRQRKMLNPVFSIAHMREMVPIFYGVAAKVHRALLEKTSNGPQEVDIVDWMTRLALELIGQSGLGYSFDELTEDAIRHPYALASSQLVPSQGQKMTLLQMSLLPYLTKIGTPQFRRFIVDSLPFKDIQDFKGVLDVLHRTSEEVLESKRKAIAEGDEAVAAQIGRGKDIISILMKANMQASEAERMSDEELLGQVNSLTFAATDTTSGALSRTLHLLAQYKDVQAKAREEIINARKENGGDDIGYDELVSLPYLDAICRETLRLHPPVSQLRREARQDIVLPLATPIKGLDGKEMTEIPIPKGTNIHISIINSNRNPELWGPDADQWKPERWLDPLPDTLVNARIPGVYSHLLTFIGGGRSCIGFKFSQLEMKVVLALLLESFEFSPSNKHIYWSMTGITTPNTDPNSSLKQLMNPRAWDFHQSIADTYGGVVRTKGVLGSNELYVYDPKAMHHILVKVEVLGWMTRLALELIGQSGLGYTFDELTENAIQHPYGIASKSLIPVQGQEAFLLTSLMPKLARIGTPGFRKFVVDHLPFKVVKEVRDIVDVLYETSIEIFNSKRKALEEGDEALAAQVGRGKDIISILMKANMTASEEDKMTDKDVLGQITSLTFAATDTTSGALSRTLHLLALHKDVQSKLREEIRNARKESGGQDIDYDNLVLLPYLDAICRETLRLYPPVSFVMRTARRDVVLPLAKPIKGINGDQIGEVPVPKGTNVTVSILASNRNPDLWGPDAHEWKPERWLNPLPETLISAHMPGIYSHLMTFIGGSRACIGFKFSQLEMKVVLALLVETLEFSLAKQEIIWQMTGIVTPNIDPDSTTPTMPMIISIAK
ncbi:hypothetical protein CVT25_004533 [Psilocybe cyanescens]|uniref:Cytochrome P450 n=1 Tax=Psilocybe cyanescens TaxID=93625 RepID=A0A409VSE5_PSICY|nr:hypothetical protein CVT25_004533 [Psilocybe cyanescens]